MRLTESNSSKSQCLTVAKSIVKQHLQSFANVMRDGTVIGSGYGSLLTQLKHESNMLIIEVLSPDEGSRKRSQIHLQT